MPVNRGWGLDELGRAVLLLEAVVSVPAHEHLRPPLDWPPFLPNWNLQRLVQFIAAWPGEAIALCGGRKGRWWKFALHSDSIRLREVQTPKA